MTSGGYVLLSACKDEEEFIAACLESVCRQTIAPKAWVIVDDGSADRTCEIISSYLGKCPFLTLIRLPVGRPRGFDSKDRAIQIAFDRVRSLAFDFVGVLDTDVTFPSEQYYELVLKYFDADPRLAIAGGVVWEHDGLDWRERAVNVPWSVAGCVQLIRRECFEKVGGFMPLACGGSDTLIELHLRMQGWKTQSIQGLQVHHHRRTSSSGGLLRGYYRLGELDASFGSHPAFMLIKTLRRVPMKPRVTGAIALLAGYLAYYARGKHPIVPTTIVRYLRNEQLSRLRHLLPGMQSPWDPNNLSCPHD